MSALLTVALSREEGRGRVVDDAALAAIEARASERLRRGRTMRRAAIAGGAVVAVVTVGFTLVSTTEPATLAAPSATPDASATAPDPSTWPLFNGDLSAESLIASSTPRILGEDPDTPRQAALLCEMDPAINPWRDATATRSTLTETKACEAVWVGDAPILTTDTVYGALHVGADLDGGRVILDWMLSTNGESELRVDLGAIATTLTTAPAAVAPPGLRTRGAYVGGSLWVSPTQRLAVMGNGTDPHNLAAGEALFGSVDISTQPQGSALHSEELWAIAHRDVTPEVVLQVRVPPRAGAGGQELILEATATVNVDSIGATAESLLGGATPRSQSDGPARGRQAASICEAPASAPWPLSTASMDWRAAWDRSACDPVWLEAPAFAAGAFTSEATDDGAESAGYLTWSVTGVTGHALQVAQSALLVETRPSQTGSAAAMTQVDALGFTTSAWDASGSRTLPVPAYADGIFVWHLPADTGLDGGTAIDPSMTMRGKTRDLIRMREAIEGGASATALVAVPFGSDPARVLMIEVPLGKPEVVTAVQPQP